MKLLIYATGVFYLNMVAAVVGCVCVSRQFSGKKKKHVQQVYHKRISQKFGRIFYLFDYLCCIIQGFTLKLLLHQVSVWLLWFCPFGLTSITSSSSPGLSITSSALSKQ